MQSNQAKRVIEKFGGEPVVARLLGLAPSTVYRWTYPVSKRGTGGVIPAKSLIELLRLARPLGVLITSEDLDPR